MSKKKTEQPTIEQTATLQQLQDLEIADEVFTGTVQGFGEPREINTQYGTSYQLPINIKTNGTTITVSVFIRSKTLDKKRLHPRSNLYKLLTAYKCRRLRDLIGKTVNLKIDQKGFTRIVY